MNVRRIFPILSIAAVMALLAAVFAPQVALADSGGGTGVLTASGNGLAWIRGNGTITISGNGILEIRDYAGDAVIRVSGAGKKTELPSGVIRYIGFNGTASVSGSDVSVALSGYNIRLEARGTGKFILRGNGTYEVNGVHGVWSKTRQIHTLP